MTIDVDIIRVEVISDADFGGDGLTAFVDGAGRDVGVLVDQAGGNVLAGTVDHFGGGITDALSNLCDLAVLHQHIRILQFTLSVAGPHGGVADQQVLSNGLLRPAIRQKGIVDLPEASRLFFLCRISLGNGCGLKGGGPCQFIAGRVFTVSVPVITVADTTEAILPPGLFLRCEAEAHHASVMGESGGQCVLPDHTGSIAALYIDGVVDISL